MLNRIFQGSSIVLRVLIVIIVLAVGARTEAFGRTTGESQDGGAAPQSPLTLEQVIDLSLVANRTIRGSGYGVAGRKYGLITAESEFEWKYAPATTASVARDANRLGAGVTLQKKSRFGPAFRVTPELVHSESAGADGDVNGQVDVGLTIPLLRGWGREANLNAVDSARYSSRSVLRSHHLAKVNVVLDAVGAVYAIIEQQELLKLNQLQTRSFKTHVVMAAAKEKIGLATPMDVYRARIRLKDTQDRLNRNQEALQNVRDRLKLILSIPLDEPLAVTAPMDYAPLDMTAAQALDFAFEHRVELTQSADDIDNLQRSSRVAQHNLKPQLDLVGRYNHLGLEEPFEQGLASEEDYWSVSLISTTDWRRTSEKAEYQRSLLMVRAARLDRWTLMDTIRRQVRQSFDALEKSEERMRIREEQINQAKGKLALAQVKFNHGMADNFDVIEAQTELQSARTNLLAARIEHIVGRYHLQAAMGSLLEYDGDDDQQG